MHDDPQSDRTLMFWRVRRRWGGWLAGVFAVLFAAMVLWWLLSGDQATVRREVPVAPLLTLPPPPPPPPEPEQIEEAPEEEDVVEPEPLDEPLEPMPEDEPPPTPSEDLGDPVTMDALAQAGTDAFGIQSGSGGGMTGTGRGMGNTTYSRYISSVLQQALAADHRTRRLAFDDIRLDLWLNGDGQPVRVELVQGTGSDAIDEAVLTMVRELEAFDARPPASLRFPLRMSIRGRRP